MMQCDYTIYLSKYMRDHDILDNLLWKQLCRYVKNTKNINRLLKSANSKQLRNTVKIEFIMKIPHDQKEVMMFVANNGNTNWKYTELLGLKQIYNFDPFFFPRTCH